MFKMSSMTGLLMAVSLTAGVGCYPIAGEDQLNYYEARAVAECRDTLLWTGRRFVDIKLRNLEKCASTINDVLIREANGGFYSEKYFRHKLEWAYYDVCVPGFHEIGYASDLLVKKTAYRCGRVEEIVLTGDPEDSGDPLGWKSLAEILCSLGERFCALDSSYPIKTYAGLQCGIKELLVDGMVVAQLPRSLVMSYDIPDGPNMFEEVARYLNPACLGMDTCDGGAPWSLDMTECPI